MSERVTQRDVAKKAGVSNATVSLALRKHPGIPVDTRIRIEKIADAMGYAPDPMLSALSSYRKKHRPQAYQSNIAWINNFKIPSELYKYDFGDYYRGAQARSRELGYVLEEYHIAEVGENWKRLKRLLNSKGTKGILISPSEKPGARFELDLAQFSAVRFGYSYSYPVLNTAANSQFNTVLIAMQNLVALGYRRIGLILDQNVQTRTSWRFYGGFCAGQQLLRSKDRLPPLSLPKGKDMSQVAGDWARKNRVDCLISLHGMWRYQQLLDGGLDIPGKIGYADISLRADEKFLSGVCQNAWQVGAMAVDLLISMIHRQEKGIPECCSHVLADGYWVNGQTTRALV